jgi:hypothetical protein
MSKVGYIVAYNTGQASQLASAFVMFHDNSLDQWYGNSVSAKRAAKRFRKNCNAGRANKRPVTTAILRTDHGAVKVFDSGYISVNARKIPVKLWTK